MDNEKMPEKQKPALKKNHVRKSPRNCVKQHIFFVQLRSSIFPWLIQDPLQVLIQDPKSESVSRLSTILAESVDHHLPSGLLNHHLPRAHLMNICQERIWWSSTEEQIRNCGRDQAMRCLIVIRPPVSNWTLLHTHFVQTGLHDHFQAEVWRGMVRYGMGCRYDTLHCVLWLGYRL